jgi:hypothetical protein
MTAPAEVTALHTRLMKCALEIDDARAYWRLRDPAAPPPIASEAFAFFWFGDRSLARVEVLLANFRARFDAFPPALEVLHRWTSMDPETRALIGHWHLQLADPLYRAFTGEFLVRRRAALNPDLTRDRVVEWMKQQGPARWTVATHIQFASKLLSAAYAAGLVGSNRDPRPLRFPRVPDEALGYLVHLLRGLGFAGTLLANPYLASVGLEGPLLDDRLRHVPGLRFRRMGDLVDFGWEHPDLVAWAEAVLPLDPAPATEARA